MRTCGTSAESARGYKMNNLIRTRQWLAGLAISVIALAGCESTPKIRANTDPGADFSQYHTYDFFDPLGTEQAEYQSIFTRYMKNAVGRELEMRGYKRDLNPDLLVNFNARVDEKIRVSSTPNSGMYYGYRGGPYGSSRHYGVHAGYPSSTTQVSQYKEGTINIDLVDRARNQLAWEGIAEGKVTEKSLENLEGAVNETIALIFGKYPYRAGQ